MGFLGERENSGKKRSEEMARRYRTSWVYRNGDEVKKKKSHMVERRSIEADEVIRASWG